MKQINLSGLDWQLTGTKPHYWRLWEQMDEMRIKHPENAPVKARVPGSVQQSLLDAGLIPDWNYGTAYRDIEWIENRHWIYMADIPDEYLQGGTSVKLRCNGLDDNGEVWINGQKAGEFNNTHLDYCFDLTGFLKPENNRIAILFFCPERYQGQVYWTSKTLIRKPRFYYNWDWCPRIVQIGICDDIFLEVNSDLQFDTVYSHTCYSVKNKEGCLKLRALFTHEPDFEKVHFSIRDHNGHIYLDKTVSASFLTACFTFDIPGIEPWNPNGAGKQTLYELSCILQTQDDVEIQQLKRQIGFRNISWKPCKDANPEADPWLLTVNGQEIFMQGINWTPIRTLFGDVTENQYREYLLKYRDMGANLLRVWGGATLEKECFYSLCDELGLMVWQEFPLSSSGICNTPPDDEQSIQSIRQIAESYVRRRHYHPSLIAWSGGNELYNTENTQPLGFEHSLLEATREVVSELDPDRRMMPASPSGPTIYYDPQLNGQGLQWDVHGPWWLPFEPTDPTMTNIRDFWESSDALFHSEAGVPGAASLSLIEKYRGNCTVLPIHAENPLWGQFSWWIESDKFEQEKGCVPAHAEEYIAWQQNRQKVALTLAVESAKKRFPACGGFLIWMGHDCFPCPANTSLFDFDGNPKPVVEKIKAIWLKSDFLSNETAQ